MKNPRQSYKPRNQDKLTIHQRLTKNDKYQWPHHGMTNVCINITIQYFCGADVTRGVPFPNRNIKIVHQTAKVAPSQIIIKPAILTPTTPKPAKDFVLEIFIRKRGMMNKTLKGPINPYNAPSTARRIILWTYLSIFNQSLKLNLIMNGEASKNDVDILHIYNKYQHNIIYRCLYVILWMNYKNIRRSTVDVKEDSKTTWLAFKAIEIGKKP